MLQTEGEQVRLGRPRRGALAIDAITNSRRPIVLH